VIDNSTVVGPYLHVGGVVGESNNIHRVTRGICTEGWSISLVLIKFRLTLEILSGI